MALARYLVGVSAIAREVHLPPPNFSNTHTHTHTHTHRTMGRTTCRAKEPGPPRSPTKKKKNRSGDADFCTGQY